MARTYETTSGDTFDLVAYKTLGSGYYMGQLIAVNPSYAHILIFPAGITLTIPELEDNTASTNPPWFTNADDDEEE